jgi:hypothetical protein
MGELALIRESGARRDRCQGEMTVELQDLLGPLAAASDDLPVRRHPGGRLELPRRRSRKSSRYRTGLKPDSSPIASRSR